MSQHDELWQDQTLAIRQGVPRSNFREHGEAIFTTSSFVFDSAEQAASCFAGSEEGYLYSRFSNPTVDAFERRLAALEGGQACIATASGMSAILTTMLTLLKQGDHVVAASSMFGSTVTLFEKLLPRYGIETSWVDVTDASAWQAAIRDNTRLMFLETPTNPLTEIADVAQLSEIAGAHEILLVVDNCFCTPALQKPLELGADYVIHSATKYLDGQGRCIGGAVVGPEDTIKKDFLAFMRSGGPSLSPFNAWIFSKGLETLSLRMERHCQNAMVLADWLQQQKGLGRVYFPGLKDHPQHQLALQQQTGFGAVVSFEVASRAAAWSLIDSTRLLSITANLGDAKSTITHPASTTHGRLDQAARDRAGINDGLIRIAVGLESIDDLIADLDRALNAPVHAVMGAESN